ncbi:MAG: hypothetical protein KA143_04250 [Saprospiraceae bacterium]|nr:hypothetical protein [Saprospiraceae bacterium]
MKIWSIMLFAFLFSYCKNEAPKSKDAPSVITTAQQQDLIAKVDYVDFLFYNMDISVSQNDKASINQSITFLSTAPKPATMNCPSIGRMSLQSQGKIILEADIHHQGNSCGYFTIIENKAAKGTCLMSADGMKFLTTLINGYKK